ncbi:hypothetical protein BKA80DRAFT_22648 [Phyllosticta citrichinensis]
MCSFGLNANGALGLTLLLSSSASVRCQSRHSDGIQSNRPDGQSQRSQRFRPSINAGLVTTNCILFLSVPRRSWPTPPATFRRELKGSRTSFFCNRIGTLQRKMLIRSLSLVAPDARVSRNERGGLVPSTLWRRGKAFPSESTDSLCVAPQPAENLQLRHNQIAGVAWLHLFNIHVARHTPLPLTHAWKKKDLQVYAIIPQAVHRLCAMTLQWKVPSEKDH